MYLLKIKTKEGHSFKVLAELIQKYIQDGCFTINNECIELSGTDNEKKKLIHVKLPSENFTSFKCKQRVLHIGMNMLHFYRMLKNIKKKDNTLILYIKEEDPLKLYISIVQNGEDEDKGILSHINITMVRPLTEDKPTGYCKPIVVTSKEFSKLKQLTKISNNMEITFYKRTVVFFCNKDEVYSKRIVLGDNEEDIENEIEDQHEYKQEFRSECILDLVKLGNISNNIHIYNSCDLPLYIKMNCGSLGEVHLYVKSKEFITAQEEEIQDIDNLSLN